MPLPKPCLDCGTVTTNGARCPAHATAHARPRNRKKNQRRSSGAGAARQLRRSVNQAGIAECVACHHIFPPGAVEIDHRTPLADGGTDSSGNVQVLCKDCHRTKTLAENRARKV